MSIRYSVYRIHDTVSDFIARCFKRKATDDLAAARELRRLLNTNFYVALMRTPYSDIDVEKKGTFDEEAFHKAFRSLASLQELTLAFRLVDDDSTGTVTYGEWQSFHKKYDPEHSSPGTQRTSRRKEGSPEFLEYASLLDGILMSCSRFPLMAKLEESNEAFPPRVEWLMEAMEAEWGIPKLRPHWVYATSPVPETEEGRRFPDWNGGFTVRDEGHVGMTNEDFCMTDIANGAGLTPPEVVGLRLYTGPGYEALNLSLRANSQRFPVTQYCIDSAIGKMAFVAPLQPLLRGMRKPMDPRWVRLYNIYRGVGRRRLALSDPGFVSTTTDIEVATGNDFGGPVLFTLHTMQPSQLPSCGFLSNGGDVQWVSQYPSEAEILLPSNVILVPKLRCKHVRKHCLPVPAEKAVFEFHVFYPWDFSNRCPLVTTDFLTCANALLDHVHGLDVGLAQACRGGHPTGVPTLTLPRHPPPKPLILDILPSPTASSSGRPPSLDKLDDQLSQLTDTARKPLCDPLCPSLADPLADPFPMDSAIPFVETIDDKLHSPAPFSLHPSAHFPPFGTPTSYLSAPRTPDPSLSLKLTEGIPLSSSSVSLPHPWVCSSCGDLDTGPLSTGSFCDLEIPAEALYPATPPSASSTDGSLAGSDVLRLAKLKYYTQVDVDKALEALKNKPQFDDGLGEVGLAGSDFPPVSSVLLPFESSIWNVGLWGIITGSLSAGLATLGISVPVAVGGAAAVVASVVVAIAVPLTVLHSDRAAVGTSTPTLTSSATVTNTATNPTRTATASGTPSPTRSATRSPTHSLTTTATPTPIGTSTPTLTSSATVTATNPTRTATASGTPSPTRSATRSPTHSLTTTATPTPIGTSTPTLTSSATVTNTATNPTRTATASGTTTRSATPSPTHSLTATATPTPSGTASPTQSTMLSLTHTSTTTPTSTPSGSLTHSSTTTPTPTPSPSLTLRAQTQRGSTVLFASVFVLGSNSFSLQFNSSKTYTGGDFATVDVLDDIFVLGNAYYVQGSNVDPFGCAVSMAATERNVTLTLDNGKGTCAIAAGETMRFTCRISMTSSVALKGFTLTTSQDVLPYSGQADR